MADSAHETFNHEKHTLLFDFLQGSQLRKELKTVTVEITGVADAALSIAQVVDVKSGSVNDLLTPNRNLRIAGSKLKVAGSSIDCGVYFVNRTNAERTNVDSSDIVTNKPSELIVVIPDLKPGAYALEVVTQFTVGALLKEPRTAVFDKVLTVA